jgi:hypothetical protein
MSTATLSAVAVRPSTFRLGAFELDSSAWVARIEQVVLPAAAAFVALGGLLLVS